MSSLLRSVLCGVVVALLFVVTAGDGARAQTLFLKGQTIQPVFEGWEKNPDGTFSMLFGYMNRNYEETPHVPVGPDNSFSPGPPDRGQPTHFYTRRQSYVFRVTVPADWGQKDLVWTVNHNGKALTALGTLMPHWVLDEGVWRANRGSGINGRTGGKMAPNEPPVAKVVGSDNLTVNVHEPVTLTVTATDDGKPGPRPPRPPRRGTGEALNTTPTVIVPGLPTFGGNRSGAASGVGGPPEQNIVKTRLAYETGLAVTFLHYRGPGQVTFEPMGMPVTSGGQVVTKASFSEAGTYVIRAMADDSSYTTPVDITVTVKDTAASQVVQH
jgi:hypothetical protein